MNSNFIKGKFSIDLNSINRKKSLLFQLTIKVAIVFSFLFPASLLAQTTDKITISGKWTCPPGVTRITVESWGAGGAGGGVSTPQTSEGGAGGGGGAYTIASNIAVIPGTQYNVSVGVGGSGTTGNGTDGGSSLFSTNIAIANGGRGGQANNGLGGAGGTGTYKGGNGSAGNATVAGGGGGSAGNSSAGNDASGASGGSAVAGGGNGGNGANTNPSNGKDGVVPGGGGGGARKGSGNGTASGGDGANGQVWITYYLAPTISAISADICAGGTIIITGTNFNGITAADVKIGTTQVTSITSFTATQIVAVVGSVCSGKVSVTTPLGTATSSGTFNATKLIDNNQLDYTNGAHGVLCATPDENGNAILSAPANTVFTTVNFASYGTPTGTCNAFSVNPACHAVNSQSIVENYLLGNNAATIPATNGVFDDPCVGTVKRLYIQAVYTQPICSGTSPGTITGTTPTGGSGSYSYKWEMSTTGATGSFSPAPGTNNTKNYTAPVLTQTTWYRRTVTAGCSDVSAVIVVPVLAPPSAPAATLTQPNCSISTGTITITAPKGSGIVYSIDGINYTNTTGVFAGVNPGSYIVTVKNSTGCLSSATPVTINSQPAVPTVSFTLGFTCIGGASGSILANASGGTAPYTYSLNGGSFQASNSFTGLAAGTYSVTVKANNGCTITSNAIVSPYPNSSDDQMLTGNDNWVGHMYSGLSFQNYIGRFTEPELFDEGFGGDYNCFNVISGAGTSSIYTEVFSVRFRMQSSKKGLYVVDLGADDGSRLYLNGNLIYNDWTEHSFTSRPGVLLSMSGSDSLRYEYFENAINNRVVFQNLQLVLANNLSVNSTQSLCMGSAGVAISGDVFPATLPSGISLSGTGYQWTYSTTLNGPRNNIAGAINPTFVPNTSTAPFNVPGTYYLYRNAILSSSNNTNISLYKATHESNVAIIKVTPSPTASISGTTTVCQGSPSPNITFTAAGIAAPFTFTYKINGGSNLTVSTGSGNSVTVSQPTTTANTFTYTLVSVSDATCTQAQSGTVTITVNPTSVAGSIAGSASVCSGTNSGTLTLSGQTGNVVRWESSVNGGTTWTTIANTTPSQTFTNLTQTTLYRAVVQSGVCSAVNSSAATITVNPVSAGGAVGTSTTVCSGSSGTLTLTGETGSVIRWESSINGGTSWTSIANTTNSQPYTNLTQTTQYRAVVQSGSCASANSAVATVTISATSVGGSIAGSASVCSGTNSGTLTLSGQTGNVVRWESSVNGGTTWTTIANTTLSQTFTNLTQTTQYRAVVQSGVCAAVSAAAATITVTQKPSATISYPGTPFCSSTGTAIVTFAGTTGGTFSSDAGLKINSTTGAIDLAASTPGNHTIIYTISAAGGCALFSTTASISITTQPFAQGFYPNSPYCSNIGTLVPTGSQLGLMGTLSSDAGLSINASTGVINVAASTPGLHTITYSVPAYGGCTAYSTSTDITISKAPDAKINYAGSPYCSSTGTEKVSITGTGTGTFSSTAGLSINAASGDINLTASTPGTYAVTYTVPASSGCNSYISTTSVTIKPNVGTPVFAAGSSSARCQASEIISYSASATNSTGITYSLDLASITGGNTINASTGTVTYNANWNGTTIVTAMAAGCSPSTSTHTIKVNPIPSASISYAGAPFCNSSTGEAVTIAGTSGGIFSASSPNLKIDVNTGSIVPKQSQVGTYTVTYSIAATGGCPSFVASKDIYIGIPGTWMGTVNTDWGNAANWICGLIPNSATDVEIPRNATNFPTVISDLATVRDLIIQKDASLIIDGTVKVAGNITNNKGLFDVTNGTLEMNGNTAQTIAGSIFEQKTLKNLVVSNSGPGLTVSSAANDTLKISSTLTFGTPTSKLFTGDNINLVSNMSTTANVGVVKPGNIITGKVIVDRFIGTGITHEKSWQLLAAPTTTQTIKESWMEGGALTSTATGYGSWITGTTGTAGGFDASSASPAMKVYSPVSDSWVSVGDPRTTPIHNDNGYMIFVRGDRSVVNASGPNSTANPTNLRSKGNLLTGTLPAINVPAGKYQSIGNPYASRIEFSKLIKNNVDNVFYVWDPLLYGYYGYGGYQTLSATNNFKPVSPNGVSTANYQLGNSYPYIESGQAFFVHNSTASNGTVVFTEDAKASSSRQVNRVANVLKERQFFRVYLYTSAGAIADGNAVAFDNNFDNGIDVDDALKITNSGENFGLKRLGKILSVEARSPIVESDTIYYNLTNFAKQTYTLRFEPENMRGTGMSAFLVDKYMKTTTPVSLEGSSSINLTINTDAASFAADRLMVVFREMAPMPVTFTSINASQKNADILVQWKVENESNILRYEIEKSTDGNNFTKAGTVAAINGPANKYSWLDQNVNAALNYYRIRSIDFTGKESYTQIVKVVIANPQADITVFPNPIKNNMINLQLNNQSAGMYEVQLLNTIGQVIISQSILHATGSSIEKISITEKLPNGIYQLEIVKPNGDKKVIQVIK